MEDDVSELEVWTIPVSVFVSFPSPRSAFFYLICWDFFFRFVILFLFRIERKQNMHRWLRLRKNKNEAKHIFSPWRSSRKYLRNANLEGEAKCRESTEQRWGVYSSSSSSLIKRRLSSSVIYSRSWDFMLKAPKTLCNFFFFWRVKILQLLQREK